VLLYLAATMIREAGRSSSLATPDRPVEAVAAHRDFVRGLALALSSPSLIVWFASAGGAVIAGIYSRTQSPPYLFLAGFFCCGVVWAVGLLPGTAGRQGPPQAGSSGCAHLLGHVGGDLPHPRGEGLPGRAGDRVIAYSPARFWKSSEAELMQ
jgi:hypothetical protein